MENQIKTAAQWWADPDNGHAWIKSWHEKAERGKDHSKNSYFETPKMILQDILRLYPTATSICEVGSGVGCNVIPIKQSLPNAAVTAVDINPAMLGHILKQNQHIDCKLSFAHALPFADNTFDLVFTHQMLQHVSPDKIADSVKELYRITKHELWCYEGIGRTDVPHGMQTHSAHNGSWVWHIDKFISCYEIAVPKNDNLTLDRLRVYRIKK